MSWGVRLSRSVVLVVVPFATCYLFDCIMACFRTLLALGIGSARACLGVPLEGWDRRWVRSCFGCLHSPLHIPAVLCVYLSTTYSATSAIHTCFSEPPRPCTIVLIQITSRGESQGNQAICCAMLKLYSRRAAVCALDILGSWAGLAPSHPERVHSRALRCQRSLLFLVLLPSNTSCAWSLA